jgi:sugar lactone lactonase YvrE
MRAKLLLPPSLASTLGYSSFALLAGALVCLSPLAASAQSVTFAGGQTILVDGGSSGFSVPANGVAVDSAGSVFIADLLNNRVVELPKTATGYGPQTTLPASGLNVPGGVALDSAGNVFIADSANNRVVELPLTATGYGPQTTLPASGLNVPGGVALDSAGNVFIADSANNRVVELPLTASGYGPQTTLPASGLNGPDGVAVDSEGDVFIADTGNGRVLELPKTATGYGPQTTLPPLSDLDVYNAEYPAGVAVDSAGDVFIADEHNFRVVEFPRMATGYGPQTTLSTTEDPDSALAPYGVAVDGGGDVFIAGAFTEADDNGGYGQVMEIQTGSVNFGSAYVCAPGQTTPRPCSQTLLLNFNVNGGVTLGTPTVLTGGAPDLDFTFAGVYPSAADITSVNVTFAPTATGLRNGSVEITDGGGNVLATAQIYGFGLAAATTGSPVAELSTNLLQFDPVAFGSTETLPLTVTNTSGGTLIVTPSINGQSYTMASSTCASGLTANESCMLQVKFSPVKAGPHNNILTLLTNGPSNPAVNLQGVALGVSAGTEALQFGTIPLGTTEVLTVNFTNTATSGTAILGAVTTSPSYTILTTAPNTCQAGVAAGQSCTLPIQFSPVVVGPHNDYLNLTLSVDGPATAFVSLNGFASGVGTELATPLNFGTLPAYTTAMLPLTITNFGVAGMVTIGTAVNGPSFKILTTADNTCLAGIAAGQSCTLPVEFLANSVGAHNELLTLTPSGGAAASVVHLDAVEAAP